MVQGPAEPGPGPTALGHSRPHPDVCGVGRGDSRGGVSGLKAESTGDSDGRFWSGGHGVRGRGLVSVTGLGSRSVVTILGTPA